MNKHFFAILLAFLSISLMAAPKPKYKSIWLSGCACYDGYQIKKVPEGEGKLTVYNPENIKIKDVLSGKFAGNKVTDATLTFAGDLIFDGDVSYRLDGTSVTYTLHKGSFTVYTYYKENKYIVDGVEQPFVPVGWESVILVNSSIKPESNPRGVAKFEVIDSLVITRQYRGFKTNEVRLQTEKRGVSQTALNIFKHLSAFADKDYKPYILYNQYLELTSEGFRMTKSPESKLYIGEHQYLDCYSTSTDGNGYTKYELKNSALGTVSFHGENNFDWRLHVAEVFYTDAFVERKIGDGSIIYDHNVTDWKKFCSDENMQLLNQYGVSYGAEPKIVSGVCCRSYNYNGGATYLTVKYGDGSVFVGLFKTDDLMSEREPLFAALTIPQLPEKSRLAEGVLNCPNGKQVVYKDGYTLDEIIKFKKTKDREWEEYLAQEAKKKQDEQLQKQKQLESLTKSLKQKYGKYADTILNSGGREILVGTPFGLIEEVGHMISTRLEIDHGSSKCYDWFVITDDYKYRKGYFWVRDGKVSSVVYY